MQRLIGETFAMHTTLGLGGPAKAWLRLESENEIVRTVAEADAAGERFMVLGGGSNLVVSDSGFDGLVLQIASRGFALTEETVEVAAGETWDDVVAYATERGLQGIECLSGIPGTAGATPIQNVGAYGQDVAQVIVAVHAYDREKRELVELQPAACGFAYRDSVFKHSPRWVVTRVRMRLQKRAYADALRYAELTRALGDGPVELGRVRDTVIALRRGKGMVVDVNDSESRSAGSFFTNPVVTGEQLSDVARRLGVEVPSHPAENGHKIAAAWLIERCGFTKGYTRGHVGISKKHSLALVNRGGSTEELIALAREIRDGVRQRSGVILVPEPVCLGVAI